MDELHQHSYQVYGGCPLNVAVERYRQRFGREPAMIVAHPKQAAVAAGVQAAEWCQCSSTPGMGMWYLSPSRKELEVSS